jgi:hypothetical protein
MTMVTKSAAGVKPGIENHSVFELVSGMFPHSNHHTPVVVRAELAGEIVEDYAESLQFAAGELSASEEVAASPEDIHRIVQGIVQRALEQLASAADLDHALRTRELCVPIGDLISAEVAILRDRARQRRAA